MELSKDNNNDDDDDDDNDDDDNDDDDDDDDNNNNNNNNNGCLNVLCLQKISSLIGEKNNLFFIYLLLNYLL